MRKVEITMKKVLSLLLICIMCFSVLFTGCAQENENANIDDINNEQINNEQVSDNVIGDIIDSVGDKIDDVISNVLSRQQPSSQYVIDLAAKNKLAPEHLMNYADYVLYINQDKSTLKVIRDELAPGRPKDLPLDLLFNIAGTMTVQDNRYYNLGQASGTSLYFAEYSYYRDIFQFNGEYGLNMNLYYTKPNAVESAYDFFMKTIYEINNQHGQVAEIFNIVEYDESILRYNSLLSIKEDITTQSMFTIVPLNDNFVLRYNSDGDLDKVYVYINGIFIDASYGHDVTFAQKIDDMGTGLLSTLLNKETVSTASAMLKDIIEKAEAME